MRDVTIRRFRAGDFDTLYKIDQICFPRGIAYGRRELRFYLADRSCDCFVVESSSEISGFIVTEAHDADSHIITLDVLPEFRRGHLGSLLLAEAENAVANRGAVWVWLETATTNEAAIAFWTKHGYRQYGEILADYYGRAGDAYQMRKQLTAGRSTN
jgi:[ribosomal protein S18]-alanine N-acetyltransferase